MHSATALLVMALVFSLPWDQTLGIDALGGPSAALGLAAGALGGLAVLVEGRFRRLVDAHVMVIGLTVWVAASLFWSLDPDLTKDRAMAMGQVAILVLLAWEFCPGLTGARRLASAYVAGCAIPTVQLILTYLSGDQVSGRVVVGTTHPNDMAFTLALALPLAWYLSGSAGSTARWAFRAFIPCALFGVVLTGSRAGLLVAILGLLLVPWKLIAANPRRGALALVVAAALLPSVLAYLPQAQVERLSSTEGELAGGSLNGRTALWGAAWATWGDHPFLGVGAGASRLEISERIGVDQGAHNTVLSIASELGVVGVGLVALAWFAVVRRALRAAVDERRLVIMLSAVLLVGLQVRHWEYEKPLWAMFAILIGMAPVLAARDSENAIVG